MRTLNPDSSNITRGAYAAGVYQGRDPGADR